MKKIFLQCVAVISVLTISAPAFSEPVGPQISYKKDVSPVIHDYCLNCHEPGGKGFEKSGLDMSSYQSLMKGTRFGSVIKPGDSFTSILIQVIDGRVHDSIKMPYGMAGGLSKDKIGLLKKWVAQGAKDN